MEEKSILQAKTGAAYSNGWRIMKENFISLFLVFLITALAGFPMGMMHDVEEHMELYVILMQVFGFLFYIFISNPINYGADWVYLKAVRKDKYEVKETFDGFKNYLNIVLAGMLVTAIVGIGLVFILVPGIVFACRLAFVPFLVMDKKLDPVKAVEESWRLTKGHGWRIFGMALLGFLIIIGGLLALVFGVIIAFIWIRAAFASLYLAVVLEDEKKNTNETLDSSVVI